MLKRYRTHISNWKATELNIQTIWIVNTLLKPSFAQPTYLCILICQLFALHHWHCLQHTCIYDVYYTYIVHVKWYRNFFLTKWYYHQLRRVCVCVCGFSDLCARACECAPPYELAPHICVRRNWMDNKKEHFRGELRIEWWEDLRDVQVVFFSLSHSVSRWERERRLNNRFSST